MELHTAITDRLQILLADPARATPADEAMLTAVANEYPYFKAVHLLLARATGQDAAIQKAAVYSTGQQVYLVLNRTEKKQEERERTKVEAPVNTEEEPEEELVSTEVEDASMVAISAPAGSMTEEDDEEGELVNTEVEDASLVTVSAPAGSMMGGEGTGSKAEVENVHDADTALKEEFFHWDTSVEEVPENVMVANAPEIETVVPDEPEHAIPSKYDDDNMPYSFLWWLSKTRAEHQQVFQPYAAPSQQQPAAQQQKQHEPLQQQYVEHIFHLQTGLQEGVSSAEAVYHKEDGLIDAFLEKDPQIKPPPLDKLDNENKARKSAEDHHDVVSETLAAIYIEQMLYRKAIDTYEKLSLKFPEKSRYFADLIKSLEKKI